MSVSMHQVHIDACSTKKQPHCFAVMLLTGSQSSHRQKTAWLSLPLTQRANASGLLLAQDKQGATVFEPPEKHPDNKRWATQCPKAQSSSFVHSKEQNMRAKGEPSLARMPLLWAETARMSCLCLFAWMPLLRYLADWGAIT